MPLNHETVRLFDQHIGDLLNTCVSIPTARRYMTHNPSSSISMRLSVESEMVHRAISVSCLFVNKELHASSAEESR
jgi:hypothetical protein